MRPPGRQGFVQTETIGKAGVKQTEENLLELLEIEKKSGDLESPKKDYNE